MYESWYLILVFVYGACIGSFLNVLIWRLPREKKPTGRSKCPSCQHELGPETLVPVLSYIFLRGRCRYCKEKVSPRYWIIEIATALLFVLAAYLQSPNMGIDYLHLIRTLFAISICIVIFVIDLEHYLILDKVVFPSALVIIVLNLIIDIWSKTSLISIHSLTIAGLFAAILGGGAFYLLWYLSKGRWMGFGDVKLAMLIGLILGPLTALGLFLSFILGTIIGVPLLISGRKHMSSKLPFGTFLAVSVIITLLWGAGIWHWYVSLISY